MKINKIRPDGYPDTYYAATRNRELNCLRLEEDIEADVCFIGGGYTGIGAALSLAERGIKAVVLEAARVGGCASGMNGGQYYNTFGTRAFLSKSFGSFMAGQMMEFAGKYMPALVQKRLMEHSIDCSLTYGQMLLAPGKRSISEVKAKAKEIAEYCDDPSEVRYMEGDDLRREVGSDAYVAGVVNPLGAYLHPLNLCLGDAAALQSLGGTIYENSRVTSVTQGRKVRVWTEHGSVKANTLVYACNANADDVERRLNKRLFVGSVYLLATEPLGDALASQILPTGKAYGCVTGVREYVRLSEDKRLLFGGLYTLASKGRAAPFDELRARMVEVFPVLKNQPIAYRWGGHIALNRSMKPLPQLGTFAPNIYYSQGHELMGGGVAHARMMGELLAQKIAGESPIFDAVAKYKHRFMPGMMQPVLAGVMKLAERAG